MVSDPGVTAELDGSTFGMDPEALAAIESEYRQSILGETPPPAPIEPPPVVPPTVSEGEPVATETPEVAPPPVATKWDDLTDDDIEALRQHPAWERVRPRAFQGEADRITALIQQGRANELTPTEIAKARELATNLTQIAPDIGQPFVNQGYQAGMQQATEDAQREALYQYLTSEVEAHRQGDFEAEQRIRQRIPGLRDLDAVEDWRAQYRGWKRQEAQQQAAAQQQAQIAEPIWNQVAAQISDLNLDLLRTTLPGLQDLPPQAWQGLLAEGRANGGYQGMLKRVMEYARDESLKQAIPAELSAKAAEAGRNVAAQQRLQSMPSPETGTGLESVPGNLATEEDIDRALHEGRITSQQWGDLMRKKGAWS